MLLRLLRYVEHADGVPFHLVGRTRTIDEEEHTMGTKDRASNTAQDTKGRVKEAVGNITGNDDLKNKGKVDQAEAELKNAGEDLKDAVGKVKDALI
jgi:uncharacterized protein YjbJ (UPF0337 family)